MDNANKEVSKITKDTTIQEALTYGDEAFEVLAKFFGPGCMACGAAAFETIEMACLSHGLSEKDIPKVVNELNKVSGKKKSKETK
ncbi:MAG: hypothetical protein ACD_63C00070G0004 [uncultured bacterium]|nr:MAG: hypothetical protein ACD_63C00070G0004 [uncultured bacterium]